MTTRMHDHGHDRLTVRRATCADAVAIADLVNGYAAEAIMLPRTVETILAAVDDYVVACDGRGRLLGCGALREYSPSLAELVSLAVSREAHGRGVGRLVVDAVERLAVKRGFDSVFAHTLSPAFFEAVGYEGVARSLYPEKQARPHTDCMRRWLVEQPVLDRWVSGPVPHAMPAPLERAA